jgi:hypothetical protein
VYGLRIATPRVVGTRGWNLPVALLAAVTGCGIDVDLSGARFACEVAADCPAGEVCSGGYCQLPAPAPDAGPPERAEAIDGAPTGEPLVPLVLHPVADAWVDAGEPAANHGGGEVLRIDADPVTTAYLRFERDGDDEMEGLQAIASARLELYATAHQIGGYQVSSAAGGWSEATLTFANAPAHGEPVASSGALSEGTWTSVDVTSLVAQPATIDLALTTTDVTQANLASREDDEYAPRLIITFEPR